MTCCHHGRKLKKNPNKVSVNYILDDLAPLTLEAVDKHHQLNIYCKYKPFLPSKMGHFGAKWGITPSFALIAPLHTYYMPVPLLCRGAKRIVNHRLLSGRK